MDYSVSLVIGVFIVITIYIIYLMSNNRLFSNNSNNINNINNLTKINSYIKNNNTNTVNQDNFEDTKPTMIYDLGDVLVENDRTKIYKINNKSGYLYKHIKKYYTKIDKQVKINNSSKISPKIVDHGDDFYVIEDYGISMEELLNNGELDKDKLLKLIPTVNQYLDNEYQIIDLHPGNFIWSDKNQDFKIIDWDIIEKNKYNIKKSNKPSESINNFVNKYMGYSSHIKKEVRQDFSKFLIQIYKDELNKDQKISTWKHLSKLIMTNLEENNKNKK